MISFIEWAQKVHEGVAPWILHTKYEQAIAQLQNSNYYQGRKVDPNSINLSLGQLQQIYGNDLSHLLQMGIITRVAPDSNPFGGGSRSYTIRPPQAEAV